MNHKKALAEKMLKIFPIDFKVGDMVRYCEANVDDDAIGISKLLEYNDGANDTCYIKVNDRDDMLFCQWAKVELRDYTLAEVLIAIEKEYSWEWRWINRKKQIIVYDQKRYSIYELEKIKNVRFDWDLTKSLFNQSDETIKAINEVL